MKCVRFVGQGVPVRLSDQQAFRIVEIDKDGEYCSKTFWRNWYRLNSDSPVADYSEKKNDLPRARPLTGRDSAS